MTSLVQMSSDRDQNSEQRPVCSERVGAPELAARASRRRRAGGMLLPAEITWQLVQLVAWLAMAVV